MYNSVNYRPKRVHCQKHLGFVGPSCNIFFPMSYLSLRAPFASESIEKPFFSVQRQLQSWKKHTSGFKQHL